MTKPSAPLKWHGGKHYLASRIIELFPQHIHYVEPFFGGGAVFLSKSHHWIEGHSEVINDINQELSGFWKVLQNDKHFTEFHRIIEATPISKPVWELANSTQPTTPVERAVNFFIKYRQSRQGLGSDFATLSRSRTRRGMNEQASSWLSAVEGLPEAHTRLKRVVILAEDASIVIKREDSRDSFFYCDPPYMHETRSASNAYEHEMSDNDHETLLETLGGICGKFILSGYRCRLYDNAMEKFGWKRIDIEIDNKASSAKIKPIKTECLWLNYDPT